MIRFSVGQFLSGTPPGRAFTPIQVLMDKLLELLCPSDFPAVEHGGSALQTLAQQFSPDAYATAVASLSASGDAEPSIQLAHVHMLAAARLRDITEAVNAADLAAALYERGDAPTEHVHFALGRALQRARARHA